MYKQKITWDQKQYNAFIKTMTEERHAVDARDLKKIFKAAEKSPLATEAISWAKNHNVQIHIDRSCIGLGGYYQEGTGVVCISPQAMYSHARAIEVLTHEIRHAWQDYHGLLTLNKMDFSLVDFYIQTALAEADAVAHGAVASRQFCFQSAPRLAEGLYGEGALFENTHGKLKDTFKEWYTQGWRRGAYAKSVAQKRNTQLGLSILEERNLQNEIECLVREIKGADPLLLSTAFAFGRGFNNDHETYLDPKDKGLRDFFTKKAQAPIWAMTMFVDPARRPDKMMQSVRTAEKRVARMSQN